MNESVKKPLTKPGSTAKAPRKLVPRTAPRAENESLAAEAKPEATRPAASATPPATTAKARAPRKPSAVEQTVAKHQKVLADALVKAQAIKYDQPKFIKQDASAVDKPAKQGKPVKTKKIKLIRDSYAMPEAEYAHIGALKKRLAALGSEVKKSELLRGGI
ncbi:MAG: hypothetical protein KGP14_14605, partial [Betaproteobacteria bacterium]|nr:hypothetical protein [Betaproteobacteria bacterium]